MKSLILPTTRAGVAIASPADAAFILDLQKKHSDALGFLPGAAVRAYVDAGRVLLGRENDQEAGYILGRGALRYDPRIAPITQAAVRMDARRRGTGLALVDDWCDAARLDGRACVQCWCADDLDSATFWPAVGFVAIARRYPGNARARSLTLWRRPLNAATLDASLCRVPPLAGYRASKVGRIELLNGTPDERPNVSQLSLFDNLEADGRCFTL